MSSRLAMLLFALLSEKNQRIETYLEAIERQCRGDEILVVESLRDQVKRSYQGEAIGRLIDAEAYEDAVPLLRGWSRDMDSLLSRAELLPRRSALDETSTFAGALLRGWIEADLSVFLWHELNYAAETSYREHLLESLRVRAWPEGREPGRHVIFFLAEADRENAGAWTLLAHEAGHVAVEQSDLVNKVMSEAVLSDPPEPEGEDKPVWSEWVTETLSDLFGVKLAGPSYVLMFSFVALQDYDFGSNRAMRSHPPPHWRLKMLLDYANSHKEELTLRNEFLTSFEQMADICHEAMSAGPSSSELHDTWTRLVEAANTSFNDYCSNQSFGLWSNELAEQSFDAALNLRFLIPAGSYLNDKMRVREAIETQQETSIGERNLSLITEVWKERPTHPLAILTAGVFVKVRDLLAIEDIQSVPSGPHILDELLRMSIQSSTVLSAYLEAFQLYEDK